MDISNIPHTQSVSVHQSNSQQFLKDSSQIFSSMASFQKPSKQLMPQLLNYRKVMIYIMAFLNIFLAIVIYLQTQKTDKYLLFAVQIICFFKLISLVWNTHQINLNPSFQRLIFSIYSSMKSLKPKQPKNYKQISQNNQEIIKDLNKNKSNTKQELVKSVILKPGEFQFTQQKTDKRQEMIYRLTGQKNNQMNENDKTQDKVNISQKYNNDNFVYPNYKFKYQNSQMNPLSMASKMNEQEKAQRSNSNMKYNKLSLDKQRSQSMRRSLFPSNLKSEFHNRFRKQSIKNNESIPHEHLDTVLVEEKEYRSTLNELAINQKSMDTWSHNLKDYIQNNILKNFFMDNLQNIYNLHHLLSVFYARQLNEYSVFYEHICQLLGCVSRTEENHNVQQRVISIDDVLRSLQEETDTGRKRLLTIDPRVQSDIDKQLQAIMKQRLALDKYLKEQGDINIRGKRDRLLLRVFQLSQSIDSLEFYHSEQVHDLSDSWIIMNIFMNSLTLLGDNNYLQDSKQGQVQLKQLNNHSQEPRFQIIVASKVYHPSPRADSIYTTIIIFLNRIIAQNDPKYTHLISLAQQLLQ